MRRSSQRARAVRAAQILNPDLVVLDLAMPVMNGLDAARMLRRIMPAVPLIMYCGFGDKFVEQQARLIGIAALISKSRSSRHSGGQGASSAEPKSSDSVKANAQSTELFMERLFLLRISRCLRNNIPRRRFPRSTSEPTQFVQQDIRNMPFRHEGVHRVQQLLWQVFRR